MCILTNSLSMTVLYMYMIYMHLYMFIYVYIIFRIMWWNLLYFLILFILLNKALRHTAQIPLPCCLLPSSVSVWPFSDTCSNLFPWAFWNPNVVHPIHGGFQEVTENPHWLSTPFSSCFLQTSHMCMWT